MYKKDLIKEGCWWCVQGKLSGLCGNFDMKTVNEMRTPDNIDSPTPQEFGNSWNAAEVRETSPALSSSLLHVTTEYGSFNVRIF